jgi:hypothetical protein
MYGGVGIMMNESSGLLARLVTPDVEEKSGQVVAKNAPTKTDGSAEPREGWSVAKG